MLIPRSESVSNIEAATPGLVRMPAPMTLTRAMPVSDETPAAPSSATSSPTRARQRSSSSWGTVNEMSVTPWSEVFWTIMSTFTSRSASARNTRAATPGRSGTPAIVILASDRSWVTAETMACSMSGTSSSTHVPSCQVKAERTCNRTRWARAYSTDRIDGFGQPVAVISSNSSNEIRESRRAEGTIRGSVVNTPVTSV